MSFLILHIACDMLNEIKPIRVATLVKYFRLVSNSLGKMFNIVGIRLIFYIP